MLRTERPRLSRRLADGPDELDWPRLLAILTAMAALLAGYRLLIRDSQWWWSSVLMMVLVLVVAAVARAYDVARPWLPAAVVWFLGLCWAFAPQTLFGVLPTPSSFRAGADLWAGARAVIVNQQAPVEAAKPVLFVVVAAFGLLAILADTLASQLRRPHLLGLMFAAVFLVPLALTGRRLDAVVFVVVAAAWLYLLRLHTRERLGLAPGALTSPVALLAGAALAVSVILPPVIPTIASVNLGWGQSRPGVFSRGINPMLELGQNLRRNVPVTALEYTTTATNPPYLKVFTLFDFTGKSWQPSPSRRSVPSNLSAGPAADIGRKEIMTRVRVENLDSQQLPLPVPALNVDGLRGDWQWEADGLALTATNSNANGQTYAVTSLELEPTAAQMRAATSMVDGSLRRYVRLPAKMPASIAATALAVTAGADNNYDKALALQSFFRAGDFTYSETAPVAKGFDGNGVDVIAKFLQVKSGYCVHFASAMAVMARTLDIPARIAVGYAPGNEIGTLPDKQVVYEATSDDLHAWPELYFENIGWVQFEPTPTVGTVTAFSDPLSGGPLDDAQGNAANPNPRGEGLRGEGLGGPTTGLSTQPANDHRVEVGLGLCLLLLLLPASIRTVQRWWRLRRGRRSVSALWVELESTARDLGVDVTIGQTPRAFADRLAARGGMRTEALRRLLSALERERFGPPGEAGSDSADFAEVIGCLRRTATKPQLWRARMLPRSIFGAPRPPREADVLAP